MKKTCAVFLAAAMSVGACTPPGQNGILTSSSVGAATGGMMGAYVGNQLGGGTGKLLYMLTGVAIGAYTGMLVGQKLDAADMRAHHDTTYRALSEAPDGQALAWDNPETGNGGTVAPTRSYAGGAGESCRDFDVMIRTKDGVGIGRAVACQQADGTWLATEKQG